MKRILLSAGLIILVATIALGQEPWKRYTVKGEAFSVTLPTLPAMTTTSQERSIDQSAQRVLLLGAYADGSVFSVVCYANSKPQESLEDFIEHEIFTHSVWDRTTQQDLKRNGFDGKQYQATSSVPGTMQIFAVGKAIYSFQVFGAPADDTHVKEYFSSVVLGKKTSGIEVTDGAGIPYRPDASATAQAALTGKNVDKKALLIMRPQPNYTENARKNGIEGQVILKAVFSSDGSVRNIQTASGLPNGLTERAIDAAQKIKFIPAIKNGKFVSMWMQLEYHFSLN